VSNWPVELMRTGHVFGNFATCQPRYSLLAREIEKDILPYCLGTDVGTLVYSSLHLGLLTGKYKGSETFDDLRKDRADFQGERFQDICDRVAQVGEIARQYGLTTVQLVLAVTLMHPGITCAIVGIKTPEQIREAAGAMGKAVSIPDWNKVRALLTVK
jgi:aryl-alcohol dehydrogenase-like predicted oxidoreductase